MLRLSSDRSPLCTVPEQDQWKLDFKKHLEYKSKKSMGKNMGEQQAQKRKPTNTYPNSTQGGRAPKKPHLSTGPCTRCGQTDHIAQDCISVLPRKFDRAVDYMEALEDDTLDLLYDDGQPSNT